MTDPATQAQRIDEVMQWYDEQQPPTFRRSDLKHRAQFRQLTQTHGRIHNYRQRIGELEHTLTTLQADARACIGALEFLHRNIFSLERDLNVIEADLESVGSRAPVLGSGFFWGRGPDPECY